MGSRNYMFMPEHYFPDTTILDREFDAVNDNELYPVTNAGRQDDPITDR